MRMDFFDRLLTPFKVIGTLLWHCGSGGLCAAVIYKMLGNATIPLGHIITRSWRHLPKVTPKGSGGTGQGTLHPSLSNRSIYLLFTKSIPRHVGFAFRFSSFMLPLLPYEVSRKSSDGCLTNVFSLFQVCFTSCPLQQLGGKSLVQPGKLNATLFIKRQPADSNTSYSKMIHTHKENSPFMVTIPSSPQITPPQFTHIVFLRHFQM